MLHRTHVASQSFALPSSPNSSRANSITNRQASSDHEAGWKPFLVLIAITCSTCLFVYFTLSPLFFHPLSTPPLSAITQVSNCCRGTDHVEFWGRVIKPGSDHVHDNAANCCRACKDMCSDDGPCLCNSWVFCSDREKCKERFGECWLKMQTDPLNPDIQAAGPDTMWTSGLVYSMDVGVVTFDTVLGTFRIKLLPECAPISVSYFVELLKARHCSGCHFYRAEGRGDIWDEAGNRVNKSSVGPPYALIQGILEAHGVPFKAIKQETCPVIKRGTVAWVGDGPDFFISLSNHDEWYPKYTVFAHVLPSDMPVVEKLATLPTTVSIWGGVTVSVLNEFVKIKIKT